MTYIKEDLKILRLFVYKTGYMGASEGVVYPVSGAMSVRTREAAPQPISDDHALTR